MSSRSRPWSILTVTFLLAAGFVSDASPASIASDKEIRQYITALQHLPENELPRAELEIDPGSRSPWRISRDEAVEDAERFFQLLQHGWCGYEYFRAGVGKEADAVDPFTMAQQAVLARLKEKERWSPGALADLIHSKLAFVSDCHLKLGKKTFCQRHEFWFDPHLELHEEGGEYRFTLDDVSHLLLKVDGASPAPHLFPSVNAAGEAIHLLGVLSPGEPEPLVVTARSAGDEVRLRRSLARSDFRRWERFAEERIGGIAVVRIRAFADYYGRELEAIVNRAESYRGEPYVILDIRDNGGGNTRWPRQWIYSFTGHSPSLKQALTELVSRTSMTGRANLFALMLESYREQERPPVQADFERFQAEAARFDDPGAKPYWSHVAIPYIDPIPNETTLIVIQDRRVASAGEGVVSFLMNQVENVVFVGENTMGALTFGQLSAHRLPHSNLLAYLPIKLNVPLDMEIREARGFAPDYWVPAQQALNHAVAAARAGTIPSQVPLPAGYFDVAFVPERPIPSWYPGKRDFVLGAVFLVAGFVFGVVNRKRDRTNFLIAGAVALAIGAGYVFFTSSAGYLLGAVGLSYLFIGLAKRRRGRKVASLTRRRRLG